MAKNIEVAVVCQDLETFIAYAIPLIQHLFDFEYLSPGLVAQGEAEGPFISLVT
jgi:hypothetical protein